MISHPQLPVPLVRPEEMKDFLEYIAKREQKNRFDLAFKTLSNEQHAHINYELNQREIFNVAVNADSSSFFKKMMPLWLTTTYWSRDAHDAAHYVPFSLDTKEQISRAVKIRRRSLRNEWFQTVIGKTVMLLIGVSGWAYAFKGPIQQVFGS